ncbi:hypothetical protein GCM10023185_13260 [Hymenobacter saemangeumensis]|uniref:Uncharacterized protein n=1 Tax=Hymenobacter saemangeumensis TaxID=1084522 RepID=A0ABP8I7V2_9BACT
MSSSQSRPLPKARTRAELCDELGVEKRTFGRWLKLAGITHRRRVLTPREVAQCCAYLLATAV